MRVRLLQAVMHNSNHLDAGTEVNVDDDMAGDWIARKLAVDAASPDPSPAGPASSRHPIAEAQLKELESRHGKASATRRGKSDDSEE